MSDHSDLVILSIKVKNLDTSSTDALENQFRALAPLGLLSTGNTKIDKGK